VVTREDLSHGQQAVQSMHALRQFTAEHPQIDQSWFEKSNYLGLLSVSNEFELHQLIEKAIIEGISFSVFKEPDIGDQITAIALEPGQKTKKLCSQLKLALRN
jgi:hypothetical protein